MITVHQCIDLQFNKETIIKEDSYGYEIKGQDGEWYEIDREYALRYILEYVKPFNPLDYDLNVGNECTQ